MSESSSFNTSEVISRLRYLMALRHLSQRQLASLLRLDPSNLSKVLNGRLPFTEGLLNRIVVDLGVSKTWLREGAGLPFDKNPVAKDIAIDGPIQPAVCQQGTPIYDLDVTAGCRSLEELFGEIRPVGTISIPGIPEGSNIVKVRGDSMSPRIINGGYVAIRPISDLRNIFGTDLCRRARRVPHGEISPPPSRPFDGCAPQRQSCLRRHGRGPRRYPLAICR